jgi:hypothetical protein
MLFGLADSRGSKQSREVAFRSRQSGTTRIASDLLSFAPPAFGFSAHLEFVDNGVTPDFF